jgi:hypothetical protein
VVARLTPPAGGMASSFFDESARPNISIFTDLGGFFTLGAVNTKSVDYSTIPITNAFATLIITQQEDKWDINTHEMDAFHHAFVTWGHSWSKKRVTIYTDNTTCYSEDTRSIYDSARRSYEYCCSYHNIIPWPAQEHTLAEWASPRTKGISQIKY